MSATCFACHAIAKDTITWFTRDWPPAYIAQGPLQNQGTFDLLTQALIRQLPQFQHQLQMTSLSAREQKMQQDTPYCFFGALKTPEREQYLYYSDVAFLTHSVKLFMLAQHPLVERLPKTGAINLVELLQQPDFIGISEKKRTYPAAINQLIQNNRLRLVDVTEGSTNILQILGQQRADYLIEYQDRIEYLRQQSTQTFDLIQRNIQGETALEPVYVACRKTPDAVAKIAAINQALATLRPTADYQQAMLRWSSATTKRQLQQQISQHPAFQAKTP